MMIMKIKIIAIELDNIILKINIKRLFIKKVYEITFEEIKWQNYNKTKKQNWLYYQPKI